MCWIIANKPGALAERRAQKKPRRSGALFSARDLSLLRSNWRYVRRLKALWTLDYVESDSLSFRERPETLHLDFTEMDEEILPLRLLNESVALFGTKPLYSPLSQPYNLHVLGATRISAHPTLKHAVRILSDPRRHNS
jgi:hypothetical protein